MGITTAAASPPRDMPLWYSCASVSGYGDFALPALAKGVVEEAVDVGASEPAIELDEAEIVDEADGRDCGEGEGTVANVLASVKLLTIGTAVCSGPEEV